MTIAAALFGAGAPLLGGASAQTPDNAAAWRVECTGDGKVLDCRAVQQLFNRETRQLVLSILVRQPRDAKAAVMMIQVPLGISLTDPMQIKVDAGQPERQAVQTCTAAGCFVGLSVPDRLLAAMRTGTELKLSFVDGSKKAIDLTVPLLGFGLAFDKVK
ncbi:invasion associated locus B family protein [Rhodoplanes roseus]|uniref:invasion associated locus B family protein n=1 Tax=Rhodoplanes roseus TaxID=29409 RepID=UPI001473B8BA|nr:invasion associated locus B family protein [Rhodoplanes roseus]